MALDVTVERRRGDTDTFAMVYLPKLARRGGRIGMFASQKVELRGIRRAGSRTVT
jgi:hypothetical protein